jgi:hypothetical protein
MAEPDVTPLAAGVGGWFVGAADVFPAPRSWRGGLLRFGGGDAGGDTITGGSWSGATAATVCAFADGASRVNDAAAENIRQSTTRNAHAPAG